MASAGVLQGSSNHRTINASPSAMNFNLQRRKDPNRSKFSKAFVTPNSTDKDIGYIQEQFRNAKIYSRDGLPDYSLSNAVYPPHPRNMYSDLMSAVPSYKYGQSALESSKLPTLYQRTASRKMSSLATGWRSAGSFGTTDRKHQPTKEQTIQKHLQNLSKSSFTQRNISFTSSPLAWTSPHATISATGQALLSESYRSKSLYNGNKATSDNNMAKGAHLPHHTLVNYVPFYEVLGKDEDQRSGVDFSVIQKRPVERSSHNIKPGTHPELMKSVLSREKMESRASNGSVKTSRQGSPVWPGACDNLPESKANKSEKKRVRFSATVRTDKVEEPAYVESLFAKSYQKRQQKPPKEGWPAKTPLQIQGEVGEGKSERKLTPNEIESATGEDDMDEDDTNFVSPITRITVTRKNISEGQDAEIKHTVVQENYSSQTNVPRGNNSQQRILDMATRILGNSTKTENGKEPKVIEIPRPQKSSTQDMSSNSLASGYAARARRKKTTSAPQKCVQNKQIIISPTFPKQPVFQRRASMSYAAKLSKSEVIQGLKINRNQRSLSSIQDKGKLNTFSSLTAKPKSAGASSNAVPKPSVQYISIDLNITNLDNTARNSFSRNSQLLLNSSSSFQPTNFQPILSMPEHINFCDPRKTEHIMLWLDDVNKKRNIEMKLKRGASSMSSRTIS